MLAMRAGAGRLSLTLTLLALAAGAVPGGATSVTPADGLLISQIDLTFSGAEQPDSSYGLAAVNFETITASTGIGAGFLNLYTAAGWVVQNMPVDPATGFPGLGTMFNLGVPPGTPVSAIDVYADFSAHPMTSFSGAPSTPFTVGSTPYNAQGRGDLFALPPPVAVTPIIDWLSGGVTKLIWGANRTSVEQDLKQCGPGSVANSLAWLHNVHDIGLPHDHTGGIGGDPPESLVGQLDETMNRPPHDPVSDADFMNGLLEYVAENGLAGNLVLKHWGGDFAPDDYEYNGADTARSRDESGGGLALIEWILREIEHGEDVELALGRIGGGVGHWVNVIGAGSTLGVDWIAWTHDANQGQDGGVNWNDGGFQFSPVVDGRPLMFLSGFQMDFAVSESVPEPGSVALVGIGLTILGLLRFRGGRQRRKA